MCERGHMAALSRFLRGSEKTSGVSVRSSEPRALKCTFSPPKMTGALLMSLVSCLMAISQASIINRCDLARVLHKEDLDGFEGYSLNDCECCFSHSPHPFLLRSWSRPRWPPFSLSFIFQSQVQKAAHPKEPFPTFHIFSTIIN